MWSLLHFILYHVDRSFNCHVIIFSPFSYSPFVHLHYTEHLDPINVKIAELREALESVTAEQKYLKARDARHRHSMILLFLLFFPLMLLWSTSSPTIICIKIKEQSIWYWVFFNYTYYFTTNQTLVLELFLLFITRYLKVWSIPYIHSHAIYYQ